MSPGGTGPTTLAQLGEFALIAELVRDLPASDDVLLGPGDDGAVLDVGGSVVVSTDVLVEGVHFRRDWSGPADVGRKAVAVNVADVEAMGARPQGIVVGFSAPGDTEVRWVLDLAAGLRAECDAARVNLLGGDTTRGRDVTLSVTALGTLDGRAPVRRDGARPGDELAVVGRLGWAAAGLLVLSRGFRSPRAVVDVQRVPQVPYGQGAVAARAGATSMVDVSDGLLADLGHVARASGVVIDVRTGAVAIDEPLQTVGAATRVDPLLLVLTGGEDHALAATFPPGRVPPGWTVIGAVGARQDDGPGVTVDGAPFAGVPGFDHFRPGARR
ncbi:thiamine-phosphate kinase [Microlunatus flavus]|uniref:Thiamine-monophosphate kinase n=1 Tax=Microlunatus flavus TaxID=1036181 RepID=A0A1H9JDX3_9ACTN|nr:thiamine-phosphate kinase [Microlunatus flavus]SEQ85036.1 thiamine-monophosphate kinase [Microlunatus flavus]